MDEQGTFASSPSSFAPRSGQQCYKSRVKIEEIASIPFDCSTNSDTGLVISAPPIEDDLVATQMVTTLTIPETVPIVSNNDNNSNSDGTKHTTPPSGGRTTDADDALLREQIRTITARDETNNDNSSSIEENVAVASFASNDNGNSSSSSSSSGSNDNSDDAHQQQSLVAFGSEMCNTTTPTLATATTNALSLASVSHHHHDHQPSNTVVGVGAQADGEWLRTQQLEMTRNFIADLEAVTRDLRQAREREQWALAEAVNARRRAEAEFNRKLVEVQEKTARHISDIRAMAETQLAEAKAEADAKAKAETANQVAAALAAAQADSASRLTSLQAQHDGELFKVRHEWQERLNTVEHESNVNLAAMHGELASAAARQQRLEKRLEDDLSEVRDDTQELIKRLASETERLAAAETELAQLRTQRETAHKAYEHAVGASHDLAIRAYAEMSRALVEKHRLLDERAKWTTLEQTISAQHEQLHESVTHTIDHHRTSLSATLDNLKTTRLEVSACRGEIDELKLQRERLDAENELLVARIKHYQETYEKTLDSQRQRIVSLKAAVRESEEKRGSAETALATLRRSELARMTKFEVSCRERVERELLPILLKANDKKSVSESRPLKKRNVESTTAITPPTPTTPAASPTATIVTHNDVRQQWQLFRLVEQQQANQDRYLGRPVVIGSNIISGNNNVIRSSNNHAVVHPSRAETTKRKEPEKQKEQTEDLEIEKYASATLATLVASQSPSSAPALGSSRQLSPLPLTQTPLLPSPPTTPTSISANPSLDSNTNSPISVQYTCSETERSPTDLVDGESHRANTLSHPRFVSSSSLVRKRKFAQHPGP